jgi:hypothetical protein
MPVGNGGRIDAQNSKRFARKHAAAPHHSAALDLQASSRRTDHPRNTKYLTTYPKECGDVLHDYFAFWRRSFGSGSSLSPGGSDPLRIADRHHHLCADCQRSSTQRPSLIACPCGDEVRIQVQIILFNFEVVKVLCREETHTAEWVKLPAAPARRGRVKSSEPG